MKWSFFGLDINNKTGVDCVLRFVKFDPNLSRLISFDTIGYDVRTQLLKVMKFNDEYEAYEDVPEATIFEWLITIDKEAYYQDRIRTYYSKKEA